MAVTVDIAVMVITETAAVQATEEAAAARVISVVTCGVRIPAVSAWEEIFAPAADDPV